MGLGDAPLRPLGLRTQPLVLDPAAVLGAGVGLVGLRAGLLRLVPARLRQPRRVRVQRLGRLRRRRLARLDGGAVAWPLPAATARALLRLARAHRLAAQHPWILGVPRRPRSAAVGPGGRQASARADGGQAQRRRAAIRSHRRRPVSCVRTPCATAARTSAAPLACRHRPRRRGIRFLRIDRAARRRRDSPRREPRRRAVSSRHRPRRSTPAAGRHPVVAWHAKPAGGPSRRRDSCDDRESDASRSPTAPSRQVVPRSRVGGSDAASASVASSSRHR